MQKIMPIIHKKPPTYEYDYREDLDTQLRPLPEVVTYNTYFVDPQYGLDTFRVEDLYDQDKSEYGAPDNNTSDQI